MSEADDFLTPSWSCGPVCSRHGQVISMEAPSDAPDETDLFVECGWTFRVDEVKQCQTQRLEVDNKGVLWLLHRDSQAADDTSSTPHEVEESLLDTTLGAEVQDLKAAFQVRTPDSEVNLSSPWPFHVTSGRYRA